MSEVRPGNSGRADYPRMLYMPDGRMIIAHNPQEHDELHRQGWDTVPAATHQKPPVSAAATLGQMDPFNIAPIVRQVMYEVLNEVLNQRNIGRRKPDGT